MAVDKVILILMCGALLGTEVQHGNSRIQEWGWW
jgi:hypothetical protein